MKIRGSILGFVVVVAALIALLLWFEKKEPKEITSATAIKTNIVSQTTLRSNPSVSTPVHPVTPMAKMTTATVMPRPTLETKVEREIEVLSNYNDIPIIFYGELEDQFSNAVANATVNFSVQVINGYESTTERGQVESDANGLFTISGYKGQNLDVAPHKAGYVLAATDTLFWYSHLEAHPYVSNPYNPTVIKMWKLQGAVPLVGINLNCKLHYANGPIYFDLVASKVVPSGGDIRITVNRPNGLISARNPQNWNIDFEVINGGFIETSPGESSVTYSAPENGYQPSGVFDKNNGPDLVDKTLFIQSRNGQVYSKVHLLFGINDTPSGFMYTTFSGVANTNGSRNWEATVPQ